jgi:hypothetical protein
MQSPGMGGRALTSLRPEFSQMVWHVVALRRLALTSTTHTLYGPKRRPQGGVR